MRYNVLVTAPYFQPVLDRFSELWRQYDIDLRVPRVVQQLGEQELLSLVQDVDGAICGDDLFTERVLLAAPRLRVISKWGTGTDSINIEAATKLGIRIKNVPDAFSHAVADSVLGYMLCFARNLVATDREVRAGNWTKLPGHALHERILGVIGLGNVGQQVIKRALTFGMRILAHDTMPVSSRLINYQSVELVTLHELLKRADYVSINCDLNTSSFHLLGADEFALMRPTSVIINTARGSIIDEVALIRFLEQGQIRGAALDVYEREPLPTESPFRRMPNVLLGSHNANSSPDAWEKVHSQVVQNLLDVLLAEI